MARYEFVEGNSSKFWEATLDGVNLIIRFGRIGNEGQMQTKQFTTAEAARKEHDKLVADSGGWTTQLLNGYRGRDNTCHESHRLKMKKVVPIKA